MIKTIIVEDEEIIRKGLLCTVDWLSMGAVVVAACADGKEGLEAIKLHQPDVVITDIKMPVMDGLTMVETAQNEGFEFLPVVLTSYSDFEYARRSISLKVFDYLLKPVSDEKIAELLEKAAVRIEEIKRSKQAAELVSAGADGESVTLKNMQVDNPHVKYALQRIETDWKDHLSIEGIASELNISSSYLSRVFKTECGKTFLDFLNGYRVQKAVELLSTKEYRVYEVADMTGFSDYKQFHRVFKEYTSVSPTEFVKSAGAVMKK